MSTGPSSPTLREATIEQLEQELNRRKFPEIAAWLNIWQEVSIPLMPPVSQRLQRFRFCARISNLPSDHPLMAECAPSARRKRPTSRSTRRRAKS